MEAKQKIYLETSIIAAYFDFWGKSPAQKALTRKFWKTIVPRYESFISPTVIDELSEAKTVWVRHYLSFVAGIESLPIDEEAMRVSRLYLDHGLIPKSKTDDAQHLAAACRHRINFFVSWNMAHLVRPHKIEQITRFNLSHRIFIPTIAKPSDFLNE